MPYKYQLHTHTCPGSRCGRQTVEELIDALRAGGYQGCVLTNHFLHGNSGFEKTLRWEDFVGCYEEEYLRGKAYAQHLGMDLLFGIEEGVGGGIEILCYGITPQILYDHPELAERNAELWSGVLRSCGVLVIQAHPFRVKSYIPEPGLLPAELIDGIEVYNRGNTGPENACAAKAAAEHPEWILTSGADAHASEHSCIGGILCKERITGEQELAALLKSGAYQLITE